VNPKFLVVNADDLGFAPDVNAAIEELHRAGRVTNASLMVDGNYVSDALAVIRRNPGLGIGLHLDLCPVVGLYRLPYWKMRETLQEPEVLAAVASEVTRQIIRFQELGLEFTHLDGHRHFHALPELFQVVVQTAAAHGLKTIRLTKDWILPRTPSVFWEENFLKGSKELLAGYNIRYPDKFVYGCNDFEASDFEPGWNELMVHVGFDVDYYAREYKLLASDLFAQLLKMAGVELKSYRDLAQQAALRN